MLADLLCRCVGPKQPHARGTYVPYTGRQWVRTQKLAGRVKLTKRCIAAISASAATLLNAVITCKIILFQNYFPWVLQFMSIFQHVQGRWNNFEIILVFYFTCNHGLTVWSGAALFTECRHVDKCTTQVKIKITKKWRARVGPRSISLVMTPTCPHVGVVKVTWRLIFLANKC